MVKQKSPSYELAYPKFYDPKQVGEWKWNVKFPARFGDAVEWRENNRIETAAKDRLRIALMPIDCQLTFCHPDFELYVGGRSGMGAIDDTRRLCEFMYRNLRVITKIYPTMDTHLPFQIFHPAFLVNENGEHPDPRYPLPISEADVRSGKWRVDPRAAFAVTGNAGTYAGLQEHFAHYVKTLSQGGKLSLMVWPFHAMLSSKGHALMPALEEAVFFHSITRGTQPDYQIKGGNPLTENYSVLRPEVLTYPNGTALANKNVRFIKALLENDVVVIAGQAKSHCVAWTIADLLNEIMAQDPELVRKVYLLEDCTSPVVVPNVVDFTQLADDAFAQFAAAGMNVVQSTTPISEWPGIEAAALEL